MEKMIENLINGNLTDARRQAKRRKWNDVYHYLREDLAWLHFRAEAATNYLKGLGTFQQYADAEHKKL